MKLLLRLFLGLFLLLVEENVIAILTKVKQIHSGTKYYIKIIYILLKEFQSHNIAFTSMTLTYRRS